MGLALLVLWQVLGDLAEEGRGGWATEGSGGRGRGACPGPSRTVPEPGRSLLLDGDPTLPSFLSPLTTDTRWPSSAMRTR